MNFKGTKVMIRELHYENGSIDVTAAYVDENGVAHGAIRHRIPQPVGGDEAEIEMYALVSKAVSSIEAWVQSMHFDGVKGVRSEDTPEFFGIAEALNDEPDESEYDPA